MPNSGRSNRGYYAICPYFAAGRDRCHFSLRTPFAQPKMAENGRERLECASHNAAASCRDAGSARETPAQPRAVLPVAARRTVATPSGRMKDCNLSPKTRTGRTNVRSCVSESCSAVTDAAVAQTALEPLMVMMCGGPLRAVELVARRNLARRRRKALAMPPGLINPGVFGERARTERPRVPRLFTPLHAGRNWLRTGNLAASAIPRVKAVAFRYRSRLPSKRGHKIGHRAYRSRAHVCVPTQH